VPRCMKWMPSATFEPDTITLQHAGWTMAAHLSRPGSTIDDANGALPRRAPARGALWPRSPEGALRCPAEQFKGHPGRQHAEHEPTALTTRTHSRPALAHTHEFQLQPAVLHPNAPPQPTMSRTISSSRWPNAPRVKLRSTCERAARPIFSAVAFTCAAPRAAPSTACQPW